jgi:hypothetical protein
MLYVLAAIAVGMLLMLLVGLTLHPDDGETPRGAPAVEAVVAPAAVRVTQPSQGVGTRTRTSSRSYRVTPAWVVCP